MRQLIILNDTKARSKIGYNAKQSRYSSSPRVPASSSSSTGKERVGSQPSQTEDLESDSDESLTPSTHYLWGKAPRRGPRKSTSEHEPIVPVCVAYLKALIISGHAGPESSPWPDANKQWLSDKIGEAWKTMARRMGDTPGRKRPGVFDLPTAAEARKVNSTSVALRDSV